jgi:hypothetical protein
VARKITIRKEDASMNSKLRNLPANISNLAIDRRSMLRNSMLGGALLAETLLAPLGAGAARASDRAQSKSGGSRAGAAHQADGTAKQLDVIEPIKLEYVFQIRIDFSERVSFKTPTGTRAYVPAISGVIEGPRLQGIVVPHSGADFAANGHLDAHYMLKASDRQQISRNDPSWNGDADYYFRITPVFDAPVGPHDWLTRTVIVGTGKRHANPDHTIFTYYAVL